MDIPYSQVKANCQKFANTSNEAQYLYFSEDEDGWCWESRLSYNFLTDDRHLELEVIEPEKHYKVKCKDVEAFLQDVEHMSNHMSLDAEKHYILDALDSFRSVLFNESEKE